MGNSLSPTSLKSTDEEVLTCLKNFYALYQTEDDCFEKLCEIKGMGIECTACGNDNIDREYGNRNFVCGICNKKNWVTAGSFFDHIKKPSAWLLFIVLREKGININSSRFARLAGIATSTAQVIYRKICIVIEDFMSIDMPTVPSAEFFKIFGKRSRLTPAKKHPVSEQFEVDLKINEDGVPDLPVDYPNLTADQTKVLQYISEIPIHIDTLTEKTLLPVEEVTATLVILELESLVVSKPGARYVRSSPSKILSKSDSKSGNIRIFDKIINAIIDFISDEFHRVSRKYIQLYIAAIWCQKATDMWGDGKLLEACQRSKKVSRVRLREYDSLPELKLCLP